MDDADKVVIYERYLQALASQPARDFYAGDDDDPVLQTNDPQLIAQRALALAGVEIQLHGYQ